MTKEQMSEEARISAWRAERARIAKADHEARLARRGEAQAEPAKAIAPSTADKTKTLLKVVEDAKSSTPAESQSAPDNIVAQVKAAQASTFEASERSTKGFISQMHGRLKSSSPFFAIVVCPVFAAALYLLAFATPLYEAQSVIAITRSAEAGSVSVSGLLGNLERPSNLSEVFRADEYIKSQALMESLEAELGIVTEFSGDAVDPIRRLRTIPILSVSKHMMFDRFVESTIDVQSGLLKLYVRAPDRELALAISTAVLRNAELQVSQLGEQLFDNRQSLAAKMRSEAEQQVARAQAELIALQLKYREVDPKLRIESVYARISDLEDQAQSIRDDLKAAEVSGVRNKARTDALVDLEASLNDQISEERSKLVTADGSSDTPLNNLLIEYEIASLNIEHARQAVRTAIEAQAEAVQEAALNRSLFQVVVPPRTAQTPIYPKIPGMLAIVFVVCLALYSAVTALRGNRRPL